jgi:glycosyltransferase involved in cell wall biosynthesis
VILVEPPSAGTITGGYRFNEALAAALPRVRRVTATPRRLEVAVKRVCPIDRREACVVLVDSLYLRAPQSRGAVRRLGSAGHRLILLAHLLASQERSRGSVTRAGARRERCALGAFDGAIAPSAFMAQELAARGVPLHATVPIHPTALSAASRAAPPGRADFRPTTARLLSVANATPVKHLHSALPALAALRDHPWDWEIIGKRRDPRYVLRVRRLAAMHGVAGRVRFRGARSPDQVRNAVEGATALLVTSRFESFGIVANQAARAGVPVVAWRVGGLPEALGFASQSATGRRGVPRRRDVPIAAGPKDAGANGAGPAPRRATLVELNDTAGLARALKEIVSGRDGGEAWS